MINTASVWELDYCSDGMELGNGDQVCGWSVIVKQINLHSQSNVLWPGRTRGARIISREVVRFVSVCQ